MLHVPHCSTAIRGAPRIVASAPRCSSGCYQTFNVLADLSPVLPGAAECHCISPVNSGILVRQLPNTPRGTQWQRYILLMQAVFIIRLSCTTILWRILNGMGNPHRMWNSLDISPDTTESCISTEDIVCQFHVC